VPEKKGILLFVIEPSRIGKVDSAKAEDGV
jgi:hypothetical protein